MITQETIKEDRYDENRERLIKEAKEHGIPIYEYVDKVRESTSLEIIKEYKENHY